MKQQKRRYLRQAVQGAELVISEPGVFLGKTSSRVVVKKQRRVIMEMPHPAAPAYHHHDLRRDPVRRGHHLVCP